MARKERPATAGDFAPEVSTRPGAKVFADIAAASKSFRPARQVLRRVRAVPTIFPALDWKLRVGGWPLDRIAMVHGPSGDGKTLLTHGLGYSFLRRGHMYAPIDAEFTTPMPWLESLFGEYADDPRFIASRPANYEQAVDDVDKVANALGDAKTKGKVDKDTSCLFVVDSIGKLVPQNIIEKMHKHAAESKDGSVDGYAGAAGMIKAAMNKAWLDRLVPTMHDTGCAIIFIARESEDRNASANDRKFGTSWKTTGGASLYYDASLDIRVAHAKMIHEDENDYKSPVVGELHLIDVHKTKLSERESKVERTWFSTKLHGGFDRTRDLLELGCDLDVIKQSGAWYSFSGMPDKKGRRWNGKNRFLTGVEPAVLDAIEAACRAKFAEDVATRSDVVGGAA